AAFCEVLEAAERIVHLAVPAQRQGVDGEVAPARVGEEIAPELDPGVASVRLDVLAQRGRLDRLALHDEDDGAMRDAGGRNLESRLPRAPDHFLRPRRRREIEVFDFRAERKIAHGAADEPRFLSIAVENLERASKRAATQRPEIAEPSVVQTWQAGHSIRPGTSTPFSSCAGTYLPCPRGANRS